MSLLLSADRLTVRLAPEVGGSITAFDWTGETGTVPVLRPSRESVEDPLQSACFPLVPFSNRIAGGVIRFAGGVIRLRPNMVGERSVIHGQGWRNPWSVVEAQQDRAILGFDHPSGEWPWRYEARQDFLIDGAGLTARITCRNFSDRPMPCGLGFHPYFPCLGETRLDTTVAGVWTVDEAVLPIERIPVNEHYLLDGRPVCSRKLDNGYDGWNGRADITSRDTPFTLRLSSPDARYFQLYSPENGRFFVAEPVSHANNALGLPEENWDALGIRILAAGEAMSVTMRLDVIAKE